MKFRFIVPCNKLMNGFCWCRPCKIFKRLHFGDLQVPRTSLNRIRQAARMAETAGTAGVNMLRATNDMANAARSLRSLQNQITGI